MSWTECFPIMDEEMVAGFEESATPDEMSELRQWYDVDQVFNRQDQKRHVLAMSLFWKPSKAGGKVYPAPTREILMTAGELDLDLRFEPWPQYIQPILDGTPEILREFDDVVVRVYLAADLGFLVPDLTEAGCEVFLMKHPSVAHAPGVAWRLLALAENNRLVTIIDCDRVKKASLDIERTRAMEKAGLAVWRNPVIGGDLNLKREVCYRAMIGCQLGAMGGWPVEGLLHAFTWHMARGTMPCTVEVPGCGTCPLDNGNWPDYGFEEWFLTAVMYPRMAGAGVLTFAPTNARSMFLTLDVEYATWSNPDSQLVYFADQNCCRPAVIENDSEAGKTLANPSAA